MKERINLEELAKKTKLFNPDITEAEVARGKEIIEENKDVVVNLASVEHKLQMKNASSEAYNSGDKEKAYKIQKDYLDHEKSMKAYDPKDVTPEKEDVLIGAQPLDYKNKLKNAWREAYARGDKNEANRIQKEILENGKGFKAS